MADQRDLENLVAVVTGAGGGIGRATSIELASAGASLVLVDIDGSALDETAAAAAGAGAAVHTTVADVSNSESVRSYVAAAVDEFGTIDVFFNNAGVEGVVSPIEHYPEEEFDRVISVNLKGVFLGMRYVLPVMLDRGSGSVINTASVAALSGLPGTGAYNASKHAVAGLTKTAAVEVARRGVRVNAICPGVIDTRMTRTLAEGFSPENPGEWWTATADRAPVGRFGTPEEIAAVVRFLASPASSYVNGALWVVDGGFVAG